MISAFRVVLVACFLMPTIGLPKHNITVTVPDGFSNHGNDVLFCLPATWHQIAIFFIINYGSHAVTIRSRPGQTYYHTARDITYALLCPFSGVRRAIDSFGRSSWPSENHLIKAARAGALCIVVRNQQWRPTRHSHLADKASKQQQAGAISIQEDQSGDSTDKPSNRLVGAASIQEVQSGGSTDKHSNHLGGVSSIQEDQSANSLEAQFEEMNDRNLADQIEVHEDAHGAEIAEEPDPSVNTASEGHDSSSQATLLPAEAHRSYRHIHGLCKLPRGYSLTELPSNAKIISDVSDEPGDTELCSSYNVPKAIIAILQTIYASITLYRARGDQIQRYGYVAFGLTVLPYLIMSIMNLFATSLVPDYSALYIVRSLELDEAITAGAQVDGAVGRIVQSNIENEKFLTSINKQMEARNPYSFSFLSITHVHSKREVFCYPSMPFEKVGTERWTPERKFNSVVLASYIFGTTPIVIIGIWTRFDAGESTKAQRVWTMLWLVMNISCGPWLDIFSEGGKLAEAFLSLINVIAPHVFWWYFTALATIPAIGGFVVVAQMLRAYGTCVRVSGVDS